MLQHFSLLKHFKIFCERMLGALEPIKSRLLETRDANDDDVISAKVLEFQLQTYVNGSEWIRYAQTPDSMLNNILHV